MKAFSAAPMEETMPIISFDNVSFSYDDGRSALDGVTLSIEHGEFLCILGANGSGKSTLAKHMNALLAPSSGSVSVMGNNTADPSAAYAVRSAVGMVFQNPDDQIVASIVEDDVAFAPENLGLPPAEIRERVTQALSAVDLGGFEQRDVSTLSGGQKQRLCIAGALAMRPQVLVLDEATSMLDPRGRKAVLKLCRALNEQGLTIVMITHFVDEATQASRVVVLENGRIVADGAPSQVLLDADALHSWLLEAPFPVRMAHALQARGVPVQPTLDPEQLCGEIQAHTKRKTNPNNSGVNEQHTERENLKPSSAENDFGSDVFALEFENVTFSYPSTLQRFRLRSKKPKDQSGETPTAEREQALSDISFGIQHGELFGVAGHTGSGKSTLMQLCNGMLQPTAGRVLWNGQDLGSKDNARQARRDVGLVFQFPELQLFAETVYEDVAFGPRNLGLDETDVLESVRTALELVHLDLDELRDRSPFALSGGQQRRVAFAGVLAMKPSVLVLDEPAAGLDPQSKAQFLQLVKELHDAHGITVVLVSHNMADLAALCDRMLVLNEGRLFALDTPSEVFAQGNALKSIGLDLPEEYRLAHALGIEPPRNACLTLERLADAIA